MSDRPPVLKGQEGRPLLAMLGMAALLGLAVLVGFLAPALATPSGEVRTSYIPFSDSAFAGREVYQAEGCSACHTQMVRPIVTDVGLGSVALPDSNQVLGFMRVGPDLAEVGLRIEDIDQMGAFLRNGSEDHPGYALSDADLRDLLAFLSESQK